MRVCIQQAQPEARGQGEILLADIRLFAEDLAGMYVPTSDMQQFYFELAEQKGWQPRSWCVIGRELGRITERVVKKRGTKRSTVYKIPRT